MYEIEGEQMDRLTHKIRSCRGCPHECKPEPPIVGCESVMESCFIEALDGDVITACCVKRTWFDKDYRPLRVWDNGVTIEVGSMSGGGSHG